MRKFTILVVLIGAAVFAAVGLASAGSGGTTQPQLPGEAKTLDAHRMTTAEGKDLGFKASAKRSRFGLVYLFAEINLTPGKTKGGALRCPRRWHPVSGLFASDSNQVVTASDAPTSTRKWAVFVRNEGSTTVKATIGAVCEKGLPVRRA